MAQSPDGRRIRDSRNAEKYTIEQLAEKIGCSPKHLGDVEISNILKDCDMEGRMAIRDTAKRITEYGKRIQEKNK